MIVLLDSEADTAFQVIDELRSRFAEIKHVAPNGEEFSITFSCGIATFPEYQDISLIKEAADRALYAAKAGGRNKVMIA